MKLMRALQRLYSPCGERAQCCCSCSVLLRYWGLLGGQSTIKRQGLTICQEY